MNVKKIILSVIVVVAIVISVLLGVTYYLIVNGRLSDEVGLPIIATKHTPMPIVTDKRGDIAEIQALLSSQQFVRVIVEVKGNEFTVPKGNDDTKLQSEVKRLQNEVLSVLTVDDFQVTNQYSLITFFAGKISKSGLKKLLENPQVKVISMDRPNYIQ
ncbi:MAG: hypothetical protein Q8L47_01815 [bacterium]|nr:hypothetical protein [bacterium]